MPQLVASPGYPQVVVAFTPIGRWCGQRQRHDGRPGHLATCRAERWFNLTSIVSTFRLSVATIGRPTARDGRQPDRAASGTHDSGNTPGRTTTTGLEFPQTNGYVDRLALIYTDTSNNAPNPVRSRGAGPLRGPGHDPGTGESPASGFSATAINNAVFWTETPNAAAPIWYVGDPGGSPFANPPVADPPRPTPGPATGSRRATFAVPDPGNGQPPVPEDPLNGNIKIAAATAIVSHPARN